MRILFMTDTPEDPNSGAAGTEYQTILALRAQGHQVDALWSDSLPRRIAHGNLHYLLELPRAYRHVMRERLARVPYEVVHASQPHGYLAAAEARLRGPLPVFVHRSHGFEPRISAALRPWQSLAPRRTPVRVAASAVMERLLERNLRGIARQAHGHVVSSSLCAEWLREHYGVPGERIAVIAQAPPRLFQETAVPAFDAARLDRLLHVGQFVAMKGPAVLARTFELVLAKRPGATLTWVCAARHHSQARALFDAKTNERVRLLDWQPQSELLRVYDDHGIFLFPSLAEGFGKVFVEAMARGLLVVASDEGGAHDLIRDGVNGRRVPVGRAEPFARACLQAMNDPEAARRMAAAGRETALACTWERCARETAAFYARLIDMQ